VYGESKLSGKEIGNYLKQLRRLYATRFFNAPDIGATIDAAAEPAAVLPQERIA